MLTFIKYIIRLLRDIIRKSTDIKLSGRLADKANPAAPIEQKALIIFVKLKYPSKTTNVMIIPDIESRGIKDNPLPVSA